MSDLIIRNGTLVDGTGAPPRAADVVIVGGRVHEIAAPGRAAREGAQVLDATDRLVTPGFVDAHTHYDGQATWDPELAPSSWHGVTTVVMGNCGVGFAPARPDRHAFLIELMEGVEDIPGTALADGITWRWESFPEYLDELDRLPRAIDVAAQVPHGAVRAYVMDMRGTHEHHATGEDLARMAAIVREGIGAGGVGFSTNRLPLHTSIHGDPVPGTFANEAELMALARAVRETGKGLVQSVPAGAMGEDPEAPLREVELYRRLSLETGCVVTFTLVQVQTNPDQWRQVLAAAERANEQGARLVPQVAGRPAGLLMSWDTFNPFMTRPAYGALAGLPLRERLAKLREPAVRRAILSEGAHDAVGMAMMRNSYDTTFPLDRGPVYEPEPEQSLAARARREGKDVDALAYDLMCDLGSQAGDDGQPGFLHVWFSGYKGGNLDDIGEMMRHPRTVVGLADGGAHCSMLCDASLPTYVLEHWVRDRSRGPRIPVEEAVRMLSKDPADLYGFGDRGTLEVGRRADVNVIDLAGLRLHTPEIVRDLPTGAPRVVQRADGFDATVVAGEITWRAGRATGARPGRVVRS
ncbi:MAG: amidohydrolase family protein [Spirochaetaceae bacterium]|nr:amidohydrolase family protein [Myxococcales bacterium]MCB9725745.1 amidohydrolase family protein [Spirochaetaceae bacterium]HPG26262.1 amidohydrolase family protein [Myxococcota bacterium]